MLITTMALLMSLSLMVSTLVILYDEVQTQKARQTKALLRSS